MKAMTFAVVLLAALSLGPSSPIGELCIGAHATSHEMKDSLTELDAGLSMPEDNAGNVDVDVHCPQSAWASAPISRDLKRSTNATHSIDAIVAADEVIAAKGHDRIADWRWQVNPIQRREPIRRYHIMAEYSASVGFSDQQPKCGYSSETTNEIASIHSASFPRLGQKSRVRF